MMAELDQTCQENQTIHLHSLKLFTLEGLISLIFPDSIHSPSNSPLKFIVLPTQPQNYSPFHA